MSSTVNALHEYAGRVRWTGNLGEGTSGYAAYGRRYDVLVEGKPDLAGTADPAFRGEADRHNPEDLFLAAVSACHMLFYLSLCARSGVRVTAYEDDARGTMALHPGGGGRFEEVTLRPAVTVADAETVALARRLHDRAHGLCFIANSCSVPIHVEPIVHVG
ncbi:MAG TPA: OsmC family protein [Longimicrobiaceae bacterium]|nr:OsmC family protein [Longimicrobiaceae bacterium]